MQLFSLGEDPKRFKLPQNTLINIMQEMAEAILKIYNPRSVHVLPQRGWGLNFAEISYNLGIHTTLYYPHQDIGYNWTSFEKYQLKMLAQKCPIHVASVVEHPNYTAQTYQAHIRAGQKMLEHLQTNDTVILAWSGQPGFISTYYNALIKTPVFLQGNLCIVNYYKNLHNHQRLALT